MKGVVYKCCECNKIFGTSFIGDGLSCPYCGDVIIPIADVIDRNQYIDLINKKRGHLDNLVNDVRKIRVKCIKKIGKLNVGDTFSAKVINHDELYLDNGEIYPTLYFIDIWTEAIPKYESRF